MRKRWLVALVRKLVQKKRNKKQEHANEEHPTTHFITCLVALCWIFRSLTPKPPNRNHSNELD